MVLSSNKYITHCLHNLCFVWVLNSYFLLSKCLPKCLNVIRNKLTEKYDRSTLAQCWVQYTISTTQRLLCIFFSISKIWVGLSRIGIDPFASIVLWLLGSVQINMTRFWWDLTVTGSPLYQVYSARISFRSSAKCNELVKIKIFFVKTIKCNKMNKYWTSRQKTNRPQKWPPYHIYQYVRLKECFFIALITTWVLQHYIRFLFKLMILQSAM